MDESPQRGKLDEWQSQASQIYDPYHQKNILNDRNGKETLTRFNQKSFPVMEKLPIKTNYENRIKLQNNRHSLRQLLMKLESLPSPDRKPKRMQSQMSLTPQKHSFQKTLLNIKSKQFSIKEYKQVQKKVLMEKKNNQFNMATLPVRPFTRQTKLPHSNTIQIRKQRIFDLKVRSLIKKKFSEKKDYENKTKPQNYLNSLKQNSNQLSCQRRTFSKSHYNSKKLLNILFEQNIKF